jgi:hypothetical protein
MEALSHFGTAMVELDTAIGVNMYQGARLIQVLLHKRYAKFYGGKRKALPEKGMRAIEFTALDPPLPVAGCPFQALNQFPDNMSLDLLTIVRGVAATFIGVEIEFAHIQWIPANCPGDVVHDIFNGQHTLGPAKPSKSRVGHRVGFYPVAGNTRTWQEVRVVSVKHSPINDRIGQVGRETTTGGQRHVHAKNATLTIKTHLVFAAKVVA